MKKKTILNQVKPRRTSSRLLETALKCAHATSDEMCDIKLHADAFVQLQRIPRSAVMKVQHEKDSLQSNLKQLHCNTSVGATERNIFEIITDIIFENASEKDNLKSSADTVIDKDRDGIFCISDCAICLYIKQNAFLKSFPLSLPPLTTEKADAHCMSKAIAAYLQTRLNKNDISTDMAADIPEQGSDSVLLSGSTFLSKTEISNATLKSCEIPESICVEEQDIPVVKENDDLPPLSPVYPTNICFHNSDTSPSTSCKIQNSNAEEEGEVDETVKELKLLERMCSDICEASQAEATENKAMFLENNDNETPILDGPYPLDAKLQSDDESFLKGIDQNIHVGQQAELAKVRNEEFAKHVNDFNMDSVSKNPLHMYLVLRSPSFNMGRRCGDNRNYIENPRQIINSFTNIKFNKARLDFLKNATCLRTKVHSFYKPNERQKIKKPDIDVIDGLKFLSFKSEDALKTYIKRCVHQKTKNRHPKLTLQSSRLSRSFAVQRKNCRMFMQENPDYSANIIYNSAKRHKSIDNKEQLNLEKDLGVEKLISPTKTSDITKIKGWKKKRFDVIPAHGGKEHSLEEQSVENQYVTKHSCSPVTSDKSPLCAVKLQNLNDAEETKVENYQETHGNSPCAWTNDESDQGFYRVGDKEHHSKKNGETGTSYLHTDINDINKLQAPSTFKEKQGIEKDHEECMPKVTRVLGSVFESFLLEDYLQKETQKSSDTSKMHATRSRTKHSAALDSLMKKFNLVDTDVAPQESEKLLNESDKNISTSRQLLPASSNRRGVEFLQKMRQSYNIGSGTAPRPGEGPLWVDKSKVGSENYFVEMCRGPGKPKTKKELLEKAREKVSQNSNSSIKPACKQSKILKTDVGFAQPFPYLTKVQEKFPIISMKDAVSALRTLQVPAYQYDEDAISHPELPVHHDPDQTSEPVNISYCAAEHKNLHCIYGCICESLQQAGRKRTRSHCGNIKCMFECICGKGDTTEDIARRRLLDDSTESDPDPPMPRTGRRKIRIPERLKDNAMPYLQKQPLSDRFLQKISASCQLKEPPQHLPSARKRKWSSRDFKPQTVSHKTANVEIPGRGNLLHSQSNSQLYPLSASANKKTFLTVDEVIRGHDGHCSRSKFYDHKTKTLQSSGKSNDVVLVKNHAVSDYTITHNQNTALKKENNISRNSKTHMGSEFRQTTNNEEQERQCPSCYEPTSHLVTHSCNRKDISTEKDKINLQAEIKTIATAIASYFGCPSESMMFLQDAVKHHVQKQMKLGNLTFDAKEMLKEYTKELQNLASPKPLCFDKPFGCLIKNSEMFDTNPVSIFKDSLKTDNYEMEVSAKLSNNAQQLAVSSESVELKGYDKDKNEGKHSLKLTISNGVVHSSKSNSPGKLSDVVNVFNLGGNAHLEKTVKLSKTANATTDIALASPKNASLRTTAKLKQDCIVSKSDFASVDNKTESCNVAKCMTFASAGRTSTATLTMKSSISSQIEETVTKTIIDDAEKMSNSFAADDIKAKPSSEQVTNKMPTASSILFGPGGAASGGRLPPPVNIHPTELPLSTLYKKPCMQTQSQTNAAVSTTKLNLRLPPNIKLPSNAHLLIPASMLLGQQQPLLIPIQNTKATTLASGSTPTAFGHFNPVVSSSVTVLPQMPRKQKQSTLFVYAGKAVNPHAKTDLVDTSTLPSTGLLCSTSETPPVLSKKLLPGPPPLQMMSCTSLPKLASLQQPKYCMKSANSQNLSESEKDSLVALKQETLNETSRQTFQTGKVTAYSYTPKYVHVKSKFPVLKTVRPNNDQGKVSNPDPPEVIDIASSDSDSEEIVCATDTTIKEVNNIEESDSMCEESLTSIQNNLTKCVAEMKQICDSLDSKDLGDIESTLTNIAEDLLSSKSDSKGIFKNSQRQPLMAVNASKHAEESIAMSTEMPRDKSDEICEDQTNTEGSLETGVTKVLSVSENVDDFDEEVKHIMESLLDCVITSQRLDTVDTNHSTLHDYLDQICEFKITFKEVLKSENEAALQLNNSDDESSLLSVVNSELSSAADELPTFPGSTFEVIHDHFGLYMSESPKQGSEISSFTDNSDIIDVENWSNDDSDIASDNSGQNKVNAVSSQNQTTAALKLLNMSTFVLPAVTHSRLHRHKYMYVELLSFFFRYMCIRSV